MMWFEKVKQQKVLSVTLMVCTLAVGIVIGTLVNTGVRADKGDKPVTDATPLTIPSPVQLSNEFTALVKKMEPAVVNVSTTYEAKKQPAASERKQRRPRNQDDEEGDDDSFDLFRFFRGPLPEGMPRQKREGTGSGFIVDSKGYIITNYHVVDNADKLVVRLHGDQTEYKAKLIGFDHELDVAVIKIDAGKPLPYIGVGNSDGVQVGDWAVAIGSPFGLEASVTAGIISAKARNNVSGQQFQSFIQTDAAINPGNSGGPLLNIKGEVIGVNTMIATQSGGYQGIGFALPINSAVKSYNQIIKYGKVTRGSIGITWSRGQEKPDLFKALGIKGGVIVESVKGSGPAEKAGVKPEDIITAINGKPLKDGEDLVARVADTPIGEKLTLSVDRAGKKMDLPVMVRERAEVFADEPQFARFRKKGDEGAKDEGAEVKFGIYVKPLSPSEREDLKLDSERGVMVTRIQEESFAAEIGLRESDVILSINRQPVGSIEDIRKIQGTLKPGDAVAFRVARSNPLAGRGAGPKYATFFVSGTLPRQ